VFRGELEEYIGGIIHKEGGILIDIGGIPEHIRIIARFKPDRSVAEIVRLIKANSSKWLDEEYRSFGKFAWQVGYGAFSVSQSQLGALRQSVRGQAEHHRTRSFQDEYRAFQKRHEIEIDEQYVWV